MRDLWEAAQIAEKSAWVGLWQPASSPARDGLAQSEAAKGDFIFEQMAEHFKINPALDWQKRRILDVGCGPVSCIARHRLGQRRAGVDPLRYPSWVYEAYEAAQFKVAQVPFEDFATRQRFDVLTFYNALQHFDDLSAVAKVCHQVLAPGGVVYLSEYVHVPTDEAHLHELSKDLLDSKFGEAGFKMDSAVELVRLAGLVEMPGGVPIELYMGRASLD